MGGQNSLLAFLFLFLLTLLPCKGWADETWTDPSESGLELKYTDVDVVGGVAITEIVSVPADGKVVIPSKIEGNEVVEIRSVYNDDIKELVVPASVITIGDAAFEYRSSLTSLTFAEGSKLKTIGDNAFCQSGLTSVKIPASVTEIKVNAFYRTKLTEVIFENGESLEIGVAAFGHTLIREVTLPESVKSIGDQAFCDTQISEISIPKSVQSIGSYAFAECPNLASVIVESETPCTLGTDVFSNEYDDNNDPKITTDFHITVPKGYEQTYKNSWSAYEQYITESTAGSEITDGNYTYELNGDGDNTVTLVKVENVDSSSDPISFPGTFEKDGTTYTVTQIGKGEKIFAGTGSIYASADAIPNTVNTIGANAFDGIYFRDGAVIPASVKNIGDAAFVTHYNETIVGTSASSVTLKSKVAFAVGEKIFGEPSEDDFSIGVSEDLVESFKATTGWDTYKDYFISEIVDNGLRYRKYQNQDGSTLSLVGFDEESTEAKDKVVVPAEVNGVPVTYIEQNAFKGKSSLTSLDLSQATNLTVINYYAFMQTSLTEVVIPANVTTICTAAFGEISTLKKVTLYPTDITLYDQSNNQPYWTDQFMGCSNLEDVRVPKGTKSTYLKLFGSMQNKDEIIKEMDNSITSGNLKYELNADGETVTVLGFADDADVDAKENVEIPATIKVGDKDCKVTAIADHAFNSLNTKQVTVGENVTKIGAGGLSAPGRVIFKGANAPELGDKALGESYNWGANNGCYIMVPANSLKAYREATSWSNYKDAVMAEPFVIDGGVYSILDNDEQTVTFIGYTGNETEYTIPSRIYNSASGYSYDVVEMKHVQGYGISSGVKKLTIPETIKSFERGALQVNPEGNLKEIDFLCENPTSVSEMHMVLTFIDAFYVHSQEALERFQASVESEELKAKIQLAAEPITDAYYKYQLNEDGHTVTVVGIADNVTLQNEVWLRGIVSGSYVSYEVTGIAANVFAKMSGITHIHVPSSVSKIDANAFTGMTSGLKVYFERTGDISEYSKDMFGTTEVSSINVPTEAYAAYYEQLANDKNIEEKIEKPVYTLDITDDSENGVTTEMEGKTYEAGKITYKRTFSQAGQYGTIALPFNVASSEWNEYFDAVYTVSGAESMGDGLSKLKFQEVDKNASLNAKDAYFVKLKDGVQDITLTNAGEAQIVVDPMVNCHSVSYDGNDGTVTITPHASWQKVEGNGTQYYTFNADGTFGKSDYVVPFRMCLTIETSGGGNFIGAPAFFSIELPGGSTTGINGISAEKASKNAAIYSIDGKLVRKAGDSKSLAKGVYIIGGKKIVVK